MIKRLKKQWELQLFVLPALVFVAVFAIAPLWGVQIAFKDYKFKQGIAGSPWVGLKHFQALFSDPQIRTVIINTLAVSVMKAFIIFPLPIIFALMLNELRFQKFKKTIQTISYFPYFMSWAVVSLMALNWLAPSNGFINHFLVNSGILKEPYFFLGKPEAFWWVSVALEIWKNLGYAAIIYLAALTSVDMEIIEAAVIDGAGRFSRILHILIPTILPTIMILFIINIGNLLGGGLYASNFQISYTLGNPLNLPTSEILDTYVLKIGIRMSRFSYATAVSLISSVVSSVLLLFGNGVSKMISGIGYF